MVKIIFMEKSKLGQFLDNFSLGVLIFFLNYLVLKKHLKSPALCLFFSFAILFLFLYFFIKRQNKKYEKIGLKKNEQKLIEKLNYHLRSMSKNAQITFLKKVFDSDFKTYKNQFLVLKNQTAILNRLNKNKVDEEDIFFIISCEKFLHENNISEVSVFCSSVDKNLKINQNFNDEFDIFFITPELFYKLLKDKNKIPENLEKTQNPVKTSKISTLFCKNQAKNFLRVSILLFIFSMIIPFSKHYIFVGAITFFVSIVLFLFGKNQDNKKQTKLFQTTQN